jgi:Ca2+-binding RTX toxin-like protein
VNEGTDAVSTGFLGTFQFADTTVRVANLQVGYQNESVSYIGTLGQDRIFGGNNNDTITGGHSDDQLFGGRGEDTAVFRYIKSQYEINLELTGWAAGLNVDYVGPWFGDGGDTLMDFEILEFRDTMVNVNMGTDDGEWIVANGADDIIFAGHGNDSVQGGAGDDLMDGGSGQDAAVFRYNRADYDIQTIDGILHIDYVGQWYGDGTDQLTNFETLHFKDQAMHVSDLPI